MLRLRVNGVGCDCGALKKYAGEYDVYCKQDASATTIIIAGIMPKYGHTLGHINMSYS